MHTERKRLILSDQNGEWVGRVGALSTCRRDYIPIGVGGGTLAMRISTIRNTVSPIRFSLANQRWSTSTVRETDMPERVKDAGESECSG